MNGFGKALMGMIRVSTDRLMARKISSDVTMLALAAIVLLLVAAGGASAATPITNCAELQDMKNDLSGDYHLSNDIDCSCTSGWNEGTGFEPVGNFSNAFRGTFDGQGYKITNLYINRTSTDHVGLFGLAGSGSEIKNVGLENVSVSGGDYVGGLVGENYATINNSYSTGSVNGTNYVGGLVGGMCGGLVSHSYSTGNVSGSHDSVGGLVGYCYSGTITNSYWDIYRSNQSKCVGVDYDPGTIDCHEINNGNSNPDYWYYSTHAPMDMWDFDNIWAIKWPAGTTYPYLQMEKKMRGGCVCNDGWCDNVNRAYYQCGETVMESCTFNGSMTCESGDHGLIIGGDDITIDGNWHLIDGVTATASRSGIRARRIDVAPGYNVTIRNVEITNFDNGIRITGLDSKFFDVVIENCLIHDNGAGHGQGIYLRYVCDSTISNNEVYNQAGTGSGCESGGDGIFLLGNAGMHEWARNNIISYNNVHDNVKAGIFIKACPDYNTISYNNCWENGEAGHGKTGGIILRCKLCDFNSITHNDVSNNIGDGMFIGGSYNIIKYNIANDNTYGINMGRSDGGSKNNELYNNTACDNEYMDISCCFSDGGGNHGDCNTCNTTSNYNDNGITDCTYDCSPAPDLTITEKSEEWIDQANKTYNITYTIKNIGDAGAGASTTSIRIDGAEAATDPVPALAPDESYTATLDSFTISDGSDTIRVCADRDNVVMEKSKEYNNCLENVFWYPDMPDLVITEKSEEWVDFENKIYNVTCTVKNIGNADADASTTSITIDGAEAATDLVPTLAPQAIHTAKLGPFTMSDDSDTIRVCADKNNIVEEKSEDNNCKENTFEFQAMPDLVITKKFEEWVASNDTWRNYTVTYTVKNIGNVDAGASTTSIIIDEAEVAADRVEALAEGGSYTNTLGPFTMSGVSDTIRVCADKNSDVEESNEDNNCLENTFDYSEIGCVAVDGTLFRCGNTVTKSCTFNGDMTCTSGAGLIIGADGIMINGDEHRITGTTTPADCNGMGSESSPCTVSGIYNSGFDNAMIKNLEIESFCTGIALTGVCNITVNNCSIHDNGFNTRNMVTHGIHACNIAEGAPDDPALTITENEIYNNEGTGSACGSGGNGVFIFAGSGAKHEYCNISHNRLHNNAKAGFWTKMMLTRSEITHNEIWGNGYGTGITDDQRGGIVLRCAMSNENLIAHNDVHDNDVDGIYIGGNNNTIEYNNVTNNTDDGIDVGRSDGSYDNKLYENTVCDNWDSDVSTFGAGSNTTGDENTCDTTKDYDDTGTTCCTYSCGGSAGVCGDVDGLPGVTTNDGRQIFMYLLHGADEYPLADTWAADCDGLCDGITTNDGRQIFMYLLHGEEEYPLNCSC